MKSMKTNGGVARGWGTQKSVLSKWVYSMHAMISVFEGEDVDLLVILIARTFSDKIIYFFKPGKPKIQTTMYSSQSFSLYPKYKNHILFLHAIIGFVSSRMLNCTTLVTLLSLIVIHLNYLCFC
ncbi:hypothetical protein RN001_000338 [Aquatica leii]|uniref:Uncharacterized protein n=1 Tax=Aquatica leii TaxID=1421715 RepID=A0AAN7PEQ7_9COLE|nr:hypothetical protein RN001_000338 [Aquatica leii]